MLKGHAIPPQHLCVFETAMDRALLGEWEQQLDWAAFGNAIDTIVDDPCEQSVLHFGVVVMSKAEVVCLLYQAISKSLREMQSRLPTSESETACSLVVHSGQFVLEYGPGALVQELDRVGTPEQLGRAWAHTVAPHHIAASRPVPLGTELKPVGAMVMVESSLAQYASHTEGAQPGMDEVLHYSARLQHKSGELLSGACRVSCIS